MWEYTVAELPKWPAPLEEALNARAKADWELVTLCESPQPQVAIGGTILVGVFRKYKPAWSFARPMPVGSTCTGPAATMIDSTPVVTIQEPQQ